MNLQSWFGKLKMEIEKKIKKRVLKAIKERVFPGCVIGVVWKNGKRIVFPFGNFTYGHNSPLIKTGSIFDVASITKSIPTSSLALKLIDEKELNLEDRVIDFIPEFKGENKNKVLIKHLLTQTVSLAFDNRPLTLSDYKDRTAEEILDIIFTSKLSLVPGSIYKYNNAASILLGLVCERLARRPLARLAYEYFFKPLNMNRTTFKPLEKFNKNEIVPTEIDQWRGKTIQGEVHDESAYILSSKITPGSAGLFSTAPDLLNFLEMLLNSNLQPRFGNELTNRDWKAETWKAKIGLGWELNQPQYMGKFCSAKTFGKTGFTGCVVICDMEKGVGITILSNYTYPKRKSNDSLINKLRSEIADIILLSSSPRCRI